MTNPSSPFEQVVEAMFDALPSFNKQMSYDEARPDLERAARNLDRHGLLKLVEEQPDPSSKPAPRTSKDLEQPRAELLDGAEAHELYSMFLAHVCSSEFHPRHPLITGAKKLAAMLDEDHPRFNEVLSDDDDLAEQPRGEPSEEALEAAARAIEGKDGQHPYGHEYRRHYGAEQLAKFAVRAAYAIDNPSEEGPRLTREEWVAIFYRYDFFGTGRHAENFNNANEKIASYLTPSDTEQASREPKCTCERGANLDHWSRCDVHRVERSYTAPLTPSDTEEEDG